MVPPRESSAAWESALNAGQIGLWQIASGYRIENGAIVEDSTEINPVRRDKPQYELVEVKEVYYPALRPDLPFELAKVEDGDEQSAFKFIERWGLLHGGLDQMLLRPGDHLKFVWAHARTTRMILELYEAVENDDPHALTAVVDTWTSHITMLSHDGSEQDGYSVRACWGEDEGERILTTGGGNLASEVAVSVIANVTSKNLEGVNQVLLYGGQLKEWHRFSEFTALYQMSYWHIANLVEKNNRVVRCKWCRKLFQRTDGRQDFCPPPEVHREEFRNNHRARAQSLCGLNYRQSRLPKEDRDA